MLVSRLVYLVVAGIVEGAIPTLHQQFGYKDQRVQSWSTVEPDIQGECNASKSVSLLGCQGALISHFLEKPVYFSSVVLSKCPYDPEAMRRAVFERASAVCSLSDGYAVQELRLFQGEVEFEHSKRKTEETRCKEEGEEKKITASPSGKYT